MDFVDIHLQSSHALALHMQKFRFRQADREGEREKERGKEILGNNDTANAKKVDVTRVLYRCCFVNEMNFQRLK